MLLYLLNLAKFADTQVSKRGRGGEKGRKRVRGYEGCM